MAKVLSPWFLLCSDTPERIGVYEIKTKVGAFPNDTWFSYWNGEAFGWVDCEGALAAYKNRNRGTGAIVEKWRGIAK